MKKLCYIANKRNRILRKTTGRVAKTIILHIQKNLLRTTNFLRRLYFFVKIKKKLLGLRSEKFRPGCQNYMKKVQRKFFSMKYFFLKKWIKTSVRLSEKIWKSESKHRQNCPKTHSTSSEVFPRVPKKMWRCSLLRKRSFGQKTAFWLIFFSFVIYYHGKNVYWRIISVFTFIILLSKSWWRLEKMILENCSQRDW